MVNSCAGPKPQVIFIGEARIVQQLDNGNFEVTPAVILELEKLQNENELLKLEVKRLHELIEKIKKGPAGEMD